MPTPITEQFSSEQQADILKLYEDGCTQEEIGKEYGVPRRTIMKLLDRLGAPKKTHSEVQKSRFEQEFVDQVLSLRASGMVLEQIAAATGRSTSSIHRVLKKHGDNKPTKQSGPNKDIICSEYKCGSSVLRLSTKHGVNTYAVSKILRENGVEIREELFKGGGSKSQKIELPTFEDTKQWWSNAFTEYGIPSLSIFTGLTRYHIRKRLSSLGISNISLAERTKNLDSKTIIEDYSNLGNMSSVARKHNCTVQSIKNHLLANDVEIRQTSEIFYGDGNPFAGNKHIDDVVVYCRKVGTEAGIKFWEDHPEYIEVIRAKNKAIWADLNKRREDSQRISELRRLGKCGSHKGKILSRFGEISFDSSYERSLIEWCEANDDIVHVERDFMILEYEYIGQRCFIPDFKLWLSNGDFIIIEVKSEWFSKQPKERAKITAGFGKLAEKFMVVENSFDLINDRIKLSLSPTDFKFQDLKLRNSDHTEYDAFYASFHYMGRTGRRGHTLAATLAGKVIAAATFSSITRNDSAERLGVSPSEMRELVRLCIHPDFHKRNFGSWFLSRAVKDFLNENPDINVLISFADTTVGHTGSVYLAANWTYDGDTKPSYHYTTPYGTNIHKKTVYGQAVAAGMNERQWAEQNKLIRVREEVKRRFIFKRA